MKYQTFRLFQEVILAMREGRIVHGNGAVWVVKDLDGRTIEINPVEETRVVNNDYPTHYQPYTDYRGAEELEKFLALTESNISRHEMDVHHVHKMCREDVLKGRLIYTNGAQYVCTNQGYVTTYDFQGAAGKATVHVYDAHASWKYIRTYGCHPAEVSEGIKFFLRIFK